MSKKSNDNVILCKKAKISNFSISEIDRKNDSKTQYLCYPRYAHNGVESIFNFQTGVIQMTAHGLPKLGGDFFKTDEQRDFFKIPLDPTQSACMELRTLCESIDKYAIDNKETILKDFLKKSKDKKTKKNLLDGFKYIPLIRSPQSIDELDPMADDDDNTTKQDFKSRPDYVKVKLNTVFDTEFQQIKTLVFNWTGESDIDITNVNGNVKEVKVTNASDLQKYFNYMSHAIFIIMANKLYISKTAKEGTRSFGITLKCMQMVVKPSEYSGSGALFQQFAFLGASAPDNDGEEETGNNLTVDLKKKLDGEGEEDKGSDDNDDDDAGDDDADADDDDDADDDADDGNDAGVNVAVKADLNDDEDNDDADYDEGDASDYEPTPPSNKNKSGKKTINTKTISTKSSVKTKSRKA